MASSYKYFSNNDRVVGTNELREEVTNVIGTGWVTSSNPPYYFTKYGSGSTDFADSTKVFDITFGRSSDTVGTSLFIDNEKSIYNQFAKVLLGHEGDNSIKKFNLDPDDNTGAKVLHNAYFVNFSREQFSDRISQGSFKLVVNVSGAANIELKDSGSNGTEVRTCNTGLYGKLFASGSTGVNVTSDNEVQGLVFYEAGVAVVSPYIFAQSGSQNNPSGSNTDINENVLGILTGATTASFSGSTDLSGVLVGGTILDNNYAFSTHLLTASYHSTTELNSTIYFCRAYNHEFNYSSNPTFLQDSKIVVKNGDPLVPSRTYITTVGLYSDDNQLLAVAKLSEPVMKTEQSELIARVRLDF